MASYGNFNNYPNATTFAAGSNGAVGTKGAATYQESNPANNKNKQVKNMFVNTKPFKDVSNYRLMRGTATVHAQELFCVVKASR